MPIAKATEKFRFKGKICLLTSIQLTVKLSGANVWSLKTSENVGLISNLLPFMKCAHALRIVTEVYYNDDVCLSRSSFERQKIVTDKFSRYFDGLP